MKTKEQINKEIYDLTNRINNHMEIIVQDENTAEVLIAILDYGVMLSRQAKMPKDLLEQVFLGILEENYKENNSL